MGLLSLVSMGSYNGTVVANENLIDLFHETEKEKHPNRFFSTVRKIAIEAPSETKFIINDVEIVMPSTGIFELGLDYVQIEKLIFESSVKVNIIYMY